MSGKFKIPENLQHSMWSVIDAALYPVAYMALVPLLMKSMGSETFGFYVLLNSIIVVLQLFNFNMGVTALRNVSYERAMDNKDCINDLINGMLHITLLLFGGALCTGAIIGILAIKFNWWNVGNASATAVFWCILLSSIYSGQKYFDQIFQNVLKAYSNFKNAAILNIIGRMGILTLTIIMAMRGYSLAYILAANVAFYVVFLGCEFIAISKQIPFFKIGYLKETSQYRRLLNFSVWPWLQSLAVVLTFQTDRFWVSAFSGLKVVSKYGLVSTMFNHIHMIFTALAAWVLPKIAGMIAKGENPLPLYTNMRNVLLCFITFSLLLFHFTAPFIFKIWVGQQTYVEMAGYLKGFIGFELAFAHTIMPILFLNAAGKEKTAAGATFIFCFVCYLLMLAGISYVGNPTGLISGMTLSMCITMPVVNKMTNERLNIAQRWDQAIAEMLPVYASILLINVSNPFIMLAAALVVVWLLWRYYLSPLLIDKPWKLATNT